MSTNPSALLRAVFLSYASQDAQPVARIAEALRAVGVEVWFDLNELQGGDAWDAKIRGQIASCALFVPIISAATQARREGYFRLEWKLAAQRTHSMADGTPFLLPVVIDGTRDAEALVPAEFKAVQWTRLPGGETPAAFCARVQRLLRDEPAAPTLDPDTESSHARPPAHTARERTSRLRRIVATVIAVAATIGLIRWQPWRSVSTPREPPPAARSAAKPLTEAQQLVEKARKTINEGDELNPEIYALAEDLLKRAEQLDPDEAGAWALHAWVSAEVVRYAIDRSDARRAAFRSQANRAIALDPEAPDVQLAAARAKIAVNRDRAEIKGFMEDLVRRLPDQVSAYRAYAFSDPQSEETRALLQRAIEKWPNDRRLPGDLVQFLLLQGDYATALRFLTDLPPQQHTGRTLSALAFLKLWWLGDPAAARKDIARWPEWFLAENRGVGFGAIAALRAGAPADALKALGKLPRAYLHDSFYTGPRSVLAAWAHEQAGQVEAARAEWRLAIQACDQELQALPGDAAALHWKAWALARLGEKDAALPLFRILVGRSPVSIEGLPQIAGSLAGLALELGDRAEALRQIELIPRLEPARTRPITRAALDLTPFLDPIRDDPRFVRFRDSLPAPEQAIAPTPPPDKSVAVLAFANLSDDKGNEYFSDGISEELLNVLAKIPGLKVSARTSAFYFKGKETPIPEIAKKLGVAYVVEGSVRKAGDKVRITAQLIQAADGFQVWSDTFTRDLKDIFSVQDEIAGLVVSQLRAAIFDGKTPVTESAVAVVKSATLGRTANVAAYQLFLEGKFLLNLKSPEGIQRSIGLFKRCVEVDPEFALAWANLAFAYNWAISFGVATFAEAGPAAATASANAVRLAPELAEAQAAAGDSALMAWRWSEAAAASDRALQLAPGNADVLQSASWRTLVTGDLPRSINLARAALRIDPYNLGAHTTLGMALSFSERPAEAERVAATMESISPGNQLATILRWNALVQQKRWAEARAMSETADPANRAFGRVIIDAGDGQRDESTAALARLQANPQGLSAFDFAIMHAFRGENDAAFAQLEESRAEHSNAFLVVKSDPMLKNLHDDPRWPALLRKLGLADDQLR